MKVEKYSDPWDHYVVDDFLLPERFEDIKRLVEKEKEYLNMFGYYSRSNHYYRFEGTDLLPEVNDLFDKLFPDRSDGLKKINHWSIHPENFQYKLHVDNKSRLYTAVLYISPEENVGTFLAKNNGSFKDNHESSDTKSEYEVEVEFKPNRLFIHKSDPHTWHRYGSSTQRVTLNTFLVDPNLIEEGRMDTRFLIDIN